MLSRIKNKFSKFFELISKPFLFLEPNYITILGLCFALLVMISFYYKNLILALIFLILSSLMDAIDGYIARIKGKVSKFGAFLDSNVDRLSDALILLGIGFYVENLLLSYVALISFFMVSYSRSRAENFIQRCDIGFAERAERLIIIIISTILEFFFNVLIYTLIFLTIMSFITYLQRIVYTYNKLKSS